MPGRSLPTDPEPPASGSGSGSGGNDLGRRLSTAVVLFHHAVAERLGLSAADHKALDLVLRHQPVTVSRLAQLTRLSPSSTTGLVDRLEAAGLVRRQPAPDDRRRILVVATTDTQASLGEIFGALGAAMGRAMAGFSTEELLVIREYVERTIGVLEEQTQRLGPGT
ncbi:MarR family winged helix-turn-helix transcriptional regulator [Plantactinospora solaniradicis]|uniref:MarR family winged helix-turn-helix transcriptional regulator n=1 Tax=Plantactinospora solaniradicis TaxID=1723736 RepID=A0ABW1KC29_9ACTN